MKEIKAYIRPLLAYRVIKDLEQAGARDMTLIRVDAIRPLPSQGPDAEDASSIYVSRCSMVAKLELVCRDDEAPVFVEIIRSRAHSGERGDGRVFVSNVEGAVNIRTGDTGTAAL